MVSVRCCDRGSRGGRLGSGAERALCSSGLSVRVLVGQPPGLCTWVRAPRLGPEKRLARPWNPHFRRCPGEGHWNRGFGEEHEDQPHPGSSRTHLPEGRSAPRTKSSPLFGWQPAGSLRVSVFAAEGLTLGTLVRCGQLQERPQIPGRGDQRPWELSPGPRCRGSREPLVLARGCLPSGADRCRRAAPALRGPVVGWPWVLCFWGPVLSHGPGSVGLRPVLPRRAAWLSASAALSRGREGLGAWQGLSVHTGEHLWRLRCGQGLQGLQGLFVAGRPAALPQRFPGSAGGHVLCP